MLDQGWFCSVLQHRSFILYFFPSSHSLLLHSFIILVHCIIMAESSNTPLASSGRNWSYSFWEFWNPIDTCMSHIYTYSYRNLILTLKASWHGAAHASSSAKPKHASKTQLWPTTPPSTTTFVLPSHILNPTNHLC